MNEGDLELTQLSTTGFELLQSYFLSSNADAEKLTKVEKKETAAKSGYNSYYMNMDTYSYSYAKPAKKKEEQETEFFVLCAPKDLQDLEIAWKMALECRRPLVVNKAVEFLIKLYSCFGEEQEPLRA
jgi:hypothetical protein